MSIADSLFGCIAATYPTHRMAQSKTLTAIWRCLYYALSPRKPFIMRTRGYRLYAHPLKGTLTRALVRRGGWEQTQTDVFCSLLRPGGLVIDAGANFGHYALTAAGGVGADGLVIAFEPHAETFAMLEANCGLLADDNVRAVQAGLGTTDGIMDLHTDSENPGGHSYYEWNLRGPSGQFHPVAVRSLDSYLSEVAPGRPVSVIKIDVQGFETQVLMGATAVIARDRPAVFCEVTPGALRRAESSVDEVLGFFRDRGYGAKVLIDGAGPPQAMDYPELLAFFAASGAEYHDILFEVPA
tara:strand:- start:6291 stop:7181 length:891 start_codon:yes stop_codon:yes gene_type:complete